MFTNAERVDVYKNGRKISSLSSSPFSSPSLPFPAPARLPLGQFTARRGCASSAPRGDRPEIGGRGRPGGSCFQRTWGRGRGLRTREVRGDRRGGEARVALEPPLQLGDEVLEGLDLGVRERRDKRALHRGGGELVVRRLRVPRLHVGLLGLPVLVERGVVPERDDLRHAVEAGVAQLLSALRGHHGRLLARRLLEPGLRLSPLVECLVALVEESGGLLPLVDGHSLHGVRQMREQTRHVVHGVRVQHVVREGRRVLRLEPVALELLRELVAYLEDGAVVLLAERRGTLEVELPDLVLEVLGPRLPVEELLLERGLLLEELRLLGRRGLEPLLQLLGELAVLAGLGPRRGERVPDAGPVAVVLRELNLLLLRDVGDGGVLLGGLLPGVPVGERLRRGRGRWRGRQIWRGGADAVFCFRVLAPI